ncbi:Arm DNA-binding domain-containing protein [Pseudomonas ceruminis]|uniref:Arm DNA-binding domain-containing protein n=1 Tax=Pseudomonas ceruminis TaxID=2740516 RepID=UPI0023EF0E63|nr:Arm DNA-binding domain-containing protein [Pseudomonas ceruminis]
MTRKHGLLNALVTRRSQVRFLSPAPHPAPLHSAECFESPLNRPSGRFFVSTPLRREPTKSPITGGVFGACKLFDGGGMYLYVAPSGSKSWRLRYFKPNGKEGTLIIGKYPIVSLAVARTKRDEARAVLER